MKMQYLSQRRLTTLEGIDLTGVMYLDCSYNDLTSLPELPIGLKVLQCSYNRLTSLPVLPHTVEKIYC